MLADSDGEMSARRDNLQGETVPTCASKFAKYIANTTDDAIGRLFIGSQGNQQDWNLLVPRTKDESLGLKLKETQVQGIRPAYGIDSRRLETVRGERIVVAVDNNDEVLAKERVHSSCLDGVYANGDEALPQIPAWKRMGTGRVEDGVGHLDGVDDLWRSNAGGGRCGSVGYDGDCLS